MNVLSLFDGMSCGQIALSRTGIVIDNYYASELDKYAIKVTQANYPGTVQLGDVTTWRDWGIDWARIGLLIGGSPCQGFSFAGKQLAFDDPRSKLFFVYVDILNHIRAVNPNVKFMLENVKMKKEYLDVINETIGVDPVLINSALVSAQNRQRYYWTDIGVIEQPIDKNISFKSILVDTPEYHTKLTETCVNKFKRYNVKFVTPTTEKGKVLTAGDYVKLGKYGNYLKEFYPAVSRKGNPQPVVLTGDKLSCLTATYSKGIRADGRSALTVGNGEFDSMWQSGDIRKLTPIECERLQTVPDNYTNHVSNTQRYKMLGNGWTVDVIAHIFKSMK